MAYGRAASAAALVLVASVLRCRGSAWPLTGRKHVWDLNLGQMKHEGWLYVKQGTECRLGPDWTMYTRMYVLALS